MTQSAAPPQMYVPPVANPPTPTQVADARRYVTRRARDTDDLALLLACLGLEDGDE